MEYEYPEYRAEHRAKRLGRRIILIIIVLLTLSTALIVLGGGGNSTVRIGWVETTTPGRWSCRYVSFTGSMHKTVDWGQDALLLTVETEAGSLAVRVEDANGAVLFEESGLTSGSYTIAAPGRVQITLTADHHKGSFLLEKDAG